MDSSERGIGPLVGGTRLWMSVAHSDPYITSSSKGNTSLGARSLGKIYIYMSEAGPSNQKEFQATLASGGSHCAVKVNSIAVVIWDIWNT